MASSLEIGGQPSVDDFESFCFAYGALADGEHVAVVVGAIPDGDLLVPAKAAADTFHAIGYDRFAVARTTQYDTAVVFACRYGFRHWTDKVWIVAGFGGISSVVLDRVTLALEVGNDGLLVDVARVVGADCDGEFAHVERCLGSGEELFKHKKAEDS